MKITKGGAAISEALSAADLFWWRVDTALNPMVVNILLGSEDVISLSEVRDALSAPILENIRMRSVPCLHPIGRMHPYLLSGIVLAFIAWLLTNSYIAIFTGLLMGAVMEAWLGMPWYWRPIPDFVPRDHFRLHILTEPTLECLHQFLDETISIPLMKDEALWEVVVIHNTPGGGSNLLFRIHHVIGDGPGLRAWFDSICLTSEERSLDARKPSSPITNHNMSLPSFLTSLSTKVLITSILTLYSVLKLLFLPRDSNSPVKGAMIGRKKTCLPYPSLTVPMAQVRAVGKALSSNVTINDTISAWMSGAFRRYFHAIGLHPDQMLLRVTMPVNMRGAHTALENYFALIFKSLPIHRSLAAERLASMNARMNLLKMGPEARLGMMLMQIFTWLPDWAMQALVLHFTLRASAVFTNVVGPSVPYHLNGHSLTTFNFWVPSAGDLGLGISLLTYCGNATISLVVDEGLIPDWSPFANALEEEWEEMLNLMKEAETNGPTTAAFHVSNLFAPAVVNGLPQCCR